MPDGYQQGPRTSFNTTFQPASVLDHPGVSKPNGGVARAIAFARGLSGKAVVLVVVVVGFQAVMPAGSKPSAPPANWQMEAEAFRQQQEVTARSLETMATAAQIADAACLGAPLATLFMGNTREAREIQAVMQAGCAEAARIRAEMTQIQAKAARDGSALMQRYRPGASP